jgi:hypothetical protein
MQEFAQCSYRQLFTAHPELMDATFNRAERSALEATNGGVPPAG